MKKSAAYVIALVGTVAAYACFSAMSSYADLPRLPATSSMQVHRVSASGEDLMCELHDPESAGRVLEEIKRMYPDRWQRSKPVSFAPAYRLATGSTQIMVLKHGLVVAWEQDGKARSLSRQEEWPDAAKLANLACTHARRTE